MSKNTAVIDISSILSLNNLEIHKLALSKGVKPSSNIKHMLHGIIKYYIGQGSSLYSIGLVEVLPEKFGFLRSSLSDYSNAITDIYIPYILIRRFDLQTGDVIKVSVKVAEDKHFHVIVNNVLIINDKPVNTPKEYCNFEKMTPCYPEKWIKLSHNTEHNNITNRIIDLICPIGFGQRGLVIAPPKVGKTSILQSIASSILSQSISHVIFLMIGERPEEVTEAKRVLKNFKNVDIISSTFDNTAARHVHTANMIYHKAKRMAECGKDVVIFLDSLTRLTRAFNEDVPSSGRALSGGIEYQALQRSKSFFGLARNFQEYGSVTIIATILTDTGSKMDEVIFEEFKGTGNMDLVLNRGLAEKAIYPAINIAKSGTRKYDLLIDKKYYSRIRLLKNMLAEMQPMDALKTLQTKLLEYNNNDDFLQHIGALKI